VSVQTVAAPERDFQSLPRKNLWKTNQGPPG
jgi:hypothetical protein